MYIQKDQDHFYTAPELKYTLSERLKEKDRNALIKGSLLCNIIHGENLYDKKGPQYKTYCEALLPGMDQPSYRTEGID